MSAIAGDEIRQQVASLFRRGGFRPLERFLPEEHREERVAEAIALTFNMALTYAARGQRLSDAILVHHAKLRAIEPSRHLVGSKGRGVDALNKANFIAGRTELLHLDGVVDGEGGEGDQQLIGLALNGQRNPADMLASAFDLRRWVGALSRRDRKILKLRASGLTLKEVAADVGMSMSQVFERCKRLGTELAEAAELPVPRKRCKRMQ